MADRKVVSALGRDEDASLTRNELRTTGAADLIELRASQSTDEHDLDPTWRSPQDVVQSSRVIDEESPSNNHSNQPLSKQHAKLSFRKPSFLNQKQSFFDGGSQEIPSEIKEKVNALKKQGLLHHTIIEEIEANEGVLGNKQVIELLHNYDVNGDGEFSAEEISKLFNDLVRKKKQGRMLRLAVGCTFLIIALLLVTNIVLTFWMLQLTKVLNVKNGDNRLTNIQGDIVVTDKPRYYVSISDLTSLSPKALNSLTRLSFATVDGFLHNYDVQGIEIGPLDNSTLQLYFASSKQLVVTGKTAVFRKLLGSGAVVDVDVAMNQDVVYQRRLQLVTTMSDSNSRDLAHRCSSVSGVCYHTFEEIMHLNGQSSAIDAEVDVYGNRRLSTQAPVSAITYAEISADAVALSTDSRSALSEASDFLRSVFSKINMSTANTTVISFRMLDRCINYEALKESCRRPAPNSITGVSYNASQDPYAVPPFYGTVPRAGKWYFDDEIIYSKDINTIQVKVRYAQDPFKSRRLHVVMVDRHNPTHIASYDEVTTSTDPVDPLVMHAVASTYITNYKTFAINDKGGLGDISPTTGIPDKRRLQLVDDAFLEHVTKKLAGFPTITVPEEIVGVHLEDYSSAHELKSETVSATWMSRKLSTLASPQIKIDAKLSDYSYCLIPLNSTYKQKLGTKVDYLPCAQDNFTSTISTPVSEPVALFYAVGINSVRGLIQWPKPSDVIHVEEFDVVDIIPREQLKLYMDLHVKNASSKSIPNGKGRRLSGTLFWFHVYEEVGEEPTSIALRGSTSSDEEMPEFLQKAKKRKSEMKAHMHGMNKKFDELNAIVNGHRAEVMGGLAVPLPPSAASCNVPTAAPVALTLRPPAPGDPQFNPYVTTDILTTQKSQWDNHQVGFSSDYLFQKYVSSNKLIVRNIGGWFSTLSYSVSSLDGECANFNAMWSTLLGDLAFYQPIINDILTAAIDIKKGLSYVKRVRDALKTIEDIRTFMRPVAPVLGKIPYIGPLITQGFRVFSLAVDEPVIPVYNKLNNLQNKLDRDNVPCKVERFIFRMNQVEEAMTMISKANIEAQGLVIVDNYCPGNVAVKGVCNALYTPGIQLVNLLDGMKVDLQSLGDFLRSFDNILVHLNNFLIAMDLSILNKLRDIFNVLWGYLNYQFGFWFPWTDWWWQWDCSSFQYPCGVQWCHCCWFVNWPCGVDMCWGSICGWVLHSNWYMKWISFSLSDIINGFMAVFDWIQNLFVNAVIDFIKSLGISIPTISIPGLPGLELDNLLARLDALDLDLVLPNLFPNLNAFFASLMNSIPTISFCQ